MTGQKWTQNTQSVVTCESTKPPGQNSLGRLKSARTQLLTILPLVILNVYARQGWGWLSQCFILTKSLGKHNPLKQQSWSYKFKHSLLAGTSDGMLS